jgi:hypothetical protein
MARSKDSVSQKGTPDSLASFGIVGGLFLGAPAGFILMNILRRRSP